MQVLPDIERKFIIQHWFKAINSSNNPIGVENVVFPEGALHVLSLVFDLKIEEGN